jgi:hypothetical protein
MTTIDVGALAGITVRDLGDLEEQMGKPIGTLFEALSEGDLSGLDARTLAGLLWLRMRKDDPAMTYDDALDLDLGALGVSLGASPKDSPGRTRS